MPSWFLNAERVLTSDFIPAHTDVLRMRRRTLGIHRNRIQISNATFDIYDTGGERSERRKWPRCADDTHAIVMTVDISCYDRTLYEDNTVNRMQESLTVFEEVINHKRFWETDIILLFTKLDELGPKLSRTPLATCFPEFTIPPPCLPDARAFIENEFRARMKPGLFRRGIRPGRNPSKPLHIMYCSFFEGPNPAFMVTQKIIDVLSGRVWANKTDVVTPAVPLSAHD